jgi:2-amino-4-hydroxy-6-hydroxymethyldihydropteridine diphosphokinase
MGLGSNLNDRLANIHEALRRLDKHPRISVVKVSSLYETKPVGVTRQPLFLNAVARLSTPLDPDALLTVFQSVERSMGRRKTVPWGPRCIDLDLLLYDDSIVEESRLKVPHPELARRAFVLVPLAEIAPHAVDPRSGRCVAQLLSALEERDGVWRYHPGEDHGND